MSESKRTKASTRKSKALAYHEAGHAIMCLVTGRKIIRASIVADNESLGHIMNTRPPRWFQPDIIASTRSIDWIDRQLLILLAGMVSERRFTGKNNWRCARHDHSVAKDLAAKIFAPGKLLDKYISYMHERVREIVARSDIWLKIEACAEALFERQVLTGAEIKEVCDDVFVTREARLNELRRQRDQEVAREKRKRLSTKSVGKALAKRGLMFDGEKVVPVAGVEPPPTEAPGASSKRRPSSTD